MPTRAQPTLRDLLLAGWQQPSHPLSPAAQDELLLFLSELHHWNQVHSLTAVKTESEAVSRHLLDALSCWPSLSAKLSGLEAPRLLDVGSGTGVPGIPLAIVLPDLRVTLVERVARKAAFLRHVCARLGLNARVRVEQVDVRDLSDESGYAIIASRAFAALEQFLDLTWPLSGAQTQWLYMAGKLNEIKGLSATFYAHPTCPERFVLDSIEDVGRERSVERHLIWLRRAN